MVRTLFICSTDFSNYLGTRDSRMGKNSLDGFVRLDDLEGSNNFMKLLVLADYNRT